MTGNEYRMMLVMAEKHAREMSEHREMGEEETQKREKGGEGKGCCGNGKMIDKGCGNVTFGSEGI